MKSCKKCGHQLSDTATSCPLCGTAQEAVPSPQGGGVDGKQLTKGIIMLVCGVIIAIALIACVVAAL